MSEGSDERSPRASPTAMPEHGAMWLLHPGRSPGSRAGTLIVPWSSAFPRILRSGFVEDVSRLPLRGQRRNLTGFPSVCR